MNWIAIAVGGAAGALLRLSADMPLVVEIVNSETYSNRLLLLLDEMMTEGMVTMEKVQVMKYGRQQREKE